MKLLKTNIFLIPHFLLREPLNMVSNLFFLIWLHYGCCIEDIHYAYTTISSKQYGNLMTPAVNKNLNIS